MDATPREVQICRRRVLKEYDDIIRNTPPNILVALSPEDQLNWYCMIHDLQEQCYVGGEYIFQIRLSPRYPFEPPDFYMLTPNGRFETGRKLCFSNSSMHAESWSPMWTIRTMIMGFVSFFLDATSSGAGHLNMSPEAKKNFADASKQFNIDNNSEILALISQQNGR
jgi:ubiquitin-protein ligase